MNKKIRTLSVIGLFSLLAPVQQAWSAFIDFDDAGLSHLDDITNFYSGVQFNGIANTFPIGPGPYPAPLTVPATIGGAGIWNPPGSVDAPGESPPNFAVGMSDTDAPGNPGILMTFDSIITSISLTGLDYGDFTSSGSDSEQMTLTAYDSLGNVIGSEHFVTQFADGAIMGSLSFNNMKYVAFNYTNTNFGFYGIDNLQFTAVPVPAAAWLFASGLAALIGVRRKAVK